MTSNIFAARITEYAPHLHSYFADIGGSRRAMLSELAGGGGVYKPGDFCLVQISSPPRDKKGAYVTDKIRIGGVYAVLLPCDKKTEIHISAKIKDSDERERLRMIGESADVGYSAIIRTEAWGADPYLIVNDIQNLAKKWKNILHRYGEMKANGTCGDIAVHDPIICEIMKYPLSTYSEICVDTAEMFECIKRDLPELSDRLRFIPKRIFEAKSVDSVRSSLMGRKIYLRSGADIVIEKTEALTVIDVNSGGSDSSYTDVNIEAAREIMRQLRLRDIGGMIVCDFIKTDDAAEGDRLTEYMRELSFADPSRPEVLGLTALGLMEISRKRT